MPTWMRFELDGEARLGRVEGDRLRLATGDLFAGPSLTDRLVAVPAAAVLPPCAPGKFVGLWNNFHAAAAKRGLAIPAEPLYFLKPSTSFAGHGAVVRPPRGYHGRILFEGELGIVIGRRCAAVTPEQARESIFGYTIVDDITALDLVTRDAGFAQWCRAKGCDGFGVFGPTIVTGLDPAALVVRSILNGRERQNYPVRDAIFAPHEVVAHLSRDMTLEPGDLIALGTSLGAAPMKPGATIEIAIDGIGSLVNRFEAAGAAP